MHLEESYPNHNYLPAAAATILQCPLIGDNLEPQMKTIFMDVLLVLLLWSKYSLTVTALDNLELSLRELPCEVLKYCA